MGWKIENSNYTPIMTDIKIGPPELLRIVRLGGKGPCGAKCGCRKASAIKPESKQKMTIKKAFLMLLNFTTFMIQQLYLYIVIVMLLSCLKSSHCAGVLEKRCS